ncbi:sigma-70 family RNA polymerase sigma factor [Microseira sp. BLCC-F43]|jgi:DNA-directed RNA polymerase specialized sigma24 family protein|uniref:sigma-70 family RNA polymerase sigma factor n=1 Tax=Microseira sp. BLCC-F43 TaxID=3153602 RepID=UPI0035B6CC5D
MKSSDRSPTRERQLPKCIQRVAWRCKSCDSDNLHQRLKQLVAAARSYPPKSWQRRQKLNEIVRSILKSGKLWQENSPYYNDALQQTWLYLCRNLERYDPAKGSVITWLDKYLRWRLQDYREEQKQEQDRTVFNFPTAAGDTIELIDNLPACPDIPLILAETYEWVATDPDGELSATQVKGYPHVTCQVILLRRLPPEMTWKAIAQEFGIPLSTVANFYKRECLPRLRKFAQKQGYLD